jgi:Ca2+-transporting ATPase
MGLKMPINKPVKKMGMEMVKETKPWHALTVKETEALLETNKKKGLTEKEAHERLSRWGPNELPEIKKVSPIIRFLAQFNDFMIWVLLAAIFISAVLLRETFGAAVISAIVVINAILGFVQERKAEQAIAALKRLTAPTAHVIRDGKERETFARQLVPGDLILIETGDRIPCDARLIDAANLTINEAILTGESHPRLKENEERLKEDTALLDRGNVVYMGTTVASGRGKAIVVSTGADSEMGKIAELVQAPEVKKTPLQEELKSVGKRIAIACLIIAGVVLGLGVLRGNPLSLMFLAAVSLAVAAIPEGLPAIVTITLALGLERMAKKNAVIRRLPAVEALGSATIICTDKTGTLTRNEMRVGVIKTKDLTVKVGDEDFFENNRRITPKKEEQLKTLLIIGALCNDARKGAEDIYLGDPTEVALLIAAEQADLSKESLISEFPRIAEIPFDSDRKMMTTIHEQVIDRIGHLAGRYVVNVKGAPEVILNRCNRIYTAKGIEPLTEERRKEILDDNSELANKAFRTLAFAFKSIKLPEVEEATEITLTQAHLTLAEQNLIFVGLAGLIDPPRPEVYEALKECKNAKIQVAMVTGDHRLTAEAIGRELSLLSAGKEIVTSEELAKMSVRELERKVQNISIYARASAEDKLKIIDALRARGHVIAMTGDGVNDAPALGRADIGVAMGKIGADVTKEASDMVLTDDNFATIVAAIREGRHIFDNLKKFVFFLLTINISQVLVVFVAMLFGLPLPLLPVQILWMNLVTNGLPATALGVDVAEPGLMQRPPRRRVEGILETRRQVQLLARGFLIAAGALSTFLLSLYVFGRGVAVARTALFTTLVVGGILYAFSVRSETKTALQIGLFTNRSLVLAVGPSLVLQLVVIYVPFLRPLFHTQPLNLLDWGVILLGTTLPIFYIEAMKRIEA